MSKFLRILFPLIFHVKLDFWFHESCFTLGTNGRLGLSHSNNVSVPRQMSALSQYVVKKVAVHSGGKHAMALTVDGKGL